MRVSNFYIKQTSTSLYHKHGKEENLNSIYRIDVCSWIRGRYGNQKYNTSLTQFTYTPQTTSKLYRIFLYINNPLNDT